MKTILASLLLAFALPSCDSAAGNDPSTAGNHESTAIVQILPTRLPLQTENYIANEIASLSMGVIAKSAAEGIDDVTAETILNSIKVEPIPGTDMARITAYSESPDTAKRIVNEIIQAYMHHRGARFSETKEQELRALDVELIAQSDLVQDNRKELTVLIQQYGVPYFENTPSPLGKTEIEFFVSCRKKHQDLEIELALLKGRFRILEDNKVEREKLIPQIEILSAQISELGKIVDKRKEDTIKLSLDQNRYNQSLIAYQQSLEMLKRMKNKQQEDRVALHMPRTPLIVRQSAN